MSDFPPRTWTRPIWRWWYREKRIERRQAEKDSRRGFVPRVEADKALMDAMLYGRGFTRISPDGVEHVPYHVALAQSYTITKEDPGEIIR